jgi:hypothetical protein
MCNIVYFLGENSFIVTFLLDKNLVTFLLDKNLQVKEHGSRKYHSLLFQNGAGENVLIMMGGS